MRGTCSGEEGGRASQLVGMVDRSKHVGTWWSAQELWLQPKVQFVWIRLKLLLNLLLVMIYLPRYMYVHGTPLSRLPQHWPEWICQPGVFLQEGMGNSSRPSCHVNGIGRLRLKCSLQRTKRTCRWNHWRNSSHGWRVGMKQISALGTHHGRCRCWHDGRRRDGVRKWRKRVLVGVLVGVLVLVLVELRPHVGWWSQRSPPVSTLRGQKPGVQLLPQKFLLRIPSAGRMPLNLKCT